MFNIVSRKASRLVVRRYDDGGICSYSDRLHYGFFKRIFENDINISKNLNI